MRTGTTIALVTAILLAAPAGAPAQTGLDDARVRKDAAALPERLWEPGPAPVSRAGPGLPEDGGGVAPLLAVLLLLGAVGAGFLVTQLRPSAAAAPAAAPAREPEPEPLPILPSPAPAPLPIVHEADTPTETCAIALSHAWGRGQFEVRVKDKGAAHRVVARSLSFAVPAGMVITEGGGACRAHRRLLLHLVAAGWQIEEPGGGAWYERRLSRPLRPAGDLDRAFVATRPEGSEAEFVALALDEYGNAHVMARSPRFGRRRGRPVEESEPAVAAHGTLLENLAQHGWHVSGTLETWYGATLTRRRRR